MAFSTSIFLFSLFVAGSCHWDVYGTLERSLAPVFVPPLRLEPDWTPCEGKTENEIINRIGQKPYTLMSVEDQFNRILGINYVQKRGPKLKAFFKNVGEKLKPILEKLKEGAQTVITLATPIVQQVGKEILTNMLKNSTTTITIPIIPGKGGKAPDLPPKLEVNPEANPEAQQAVAGRGRRTDNIDDYYEEEEYTVMTFDRTNPYPKLTSWCLKYWWAKPCINLLNWYKKDCDRYWPISEDCRIIYSNFVNRDFCQ